MNARPDNWTAEDYARWWILQPECGETSRAHIEALLDVIDTLQQGDSTQPFDVVVAPPETPLKGSQDTGD